MYGGAERVIEQLFRLFPHADFYSVVDFVPLEQRDFLEGRPVRTTFIQSLPFAARKYRSYLPLMPLAIEQLDLSRYDLVISSHFSVANGVITGPDQLHLSYVHSPARYAWDLQHQYLHQAGLTRGIKGWVARYMLHRFRQWDVRTANGVDAFAANSEFIARRVWKIYRRKAKVIYPPVDVTQFPLRKSKEDFYLAASRFVPYKRVDLIVEAFRQMPDQRLVLIGDGPEYARLRKRITHNITVLSRQDGAALSDYMQRAKAFIHAAEEDFGITPVEAQACGTPVIAYGKGGVREIVRGLDTDRPTGIFFSDQTADRLVEAIREFQKRQADFVPEWCREVALSFVPDRFRKEFADFVSERLNIGKRANVDS